MIMVHQCLGSSNPFAWVAEFEKGGSYSWGQNSSFVPGLHLATPGPQLLISAWLLSLEKGIGEKVL